MAVTLGAVQVGITFNEQEVLIFFKGFAENTYTDTYTYIKKQILKKHFQTTHTQTHHT